MGAYELRFTVTLYPLLPLYTHTSTLHRSSILLRFRLPYLRSSIRRSTTGIIMPSVLKTPGMEVRCRSAEPAVETRPWGCLCLNRAQGVRRCRRALTSPCTSLNPQKRAHLEDLDEGLPKYVLQAFPSISNVPTKKGSAVEVCCRED